MISRRLLAALLPLLLPLALATCAPPPPPPPPAVLTLAMVGGPDQNPGADGTPSPVAVRIIQLTAVGGFERADAITLIQKEKQTLADEDLASEEFVIRPGETRTITRELKKGTQFIGALVQFRNIDNATFRATAPVAPSGPSKLLLKTSGNTVTLVPVAEPAKS
jgi:type VI secretion system protein VasD